METVQQNAEVSIQKYFMDIFNLTSLTNDSLLHFVCICIGIKARFVGQK